MNRIESNIRSYEILCQVHTAAVATMAGRELCKPLLKHWWRSQVWGSRGQHRWSQISQHLLRLLFPANYPHAPPTVVMVTPSGRLEVGCRLCESPRPAENWVKCDVAQSWWEWQNVEHTHPKNWKILRDRLMLLIPTDSCFWFLLISSSSSLEWSSSSKWRSQHDGLPSGGLTTYAMESRHVSTEHHLITRTDPCCILFAYPFGFGWT